jgi:hypothetical protein
MYVEDKDLPELEDLRQKLTAAYKSLTSRAETLIDQFETDATDHARERAEIAGYWGIDMEYVRAYYNSNVAIANYVARLEAVIRGFLETSGQDHLSEQYQTIRIEAQQLLTVDT